jgi:hypothetical protein
MRETGYWGRLSGGVPGSRSLFRIGLAHDKRPRAVGPLDANPSTMTLSRAVTTASRRCNRYISLHDIHALSHRSFGCTACRLTRRLSLFAQV